MPMTAENKQVLEQISALLIEQALSEEKRRAFLARLEYLCEAACRGDVKSDITERDEFIRCVVEGFFAGIFSGCLSMAPIHIAYKLIANFFAGVFAAWIGLDAKAHFREKDYFDLKIIRTIIVNKINEGMNIETIIDHLLFNINRRIETVNFRIGALTLGAGAGAAIAVGGTELVRTALDSSVLQRTFLGKLITESAVVSKTSDAASGGFGTHYGSHYTKALLGKTEGFFSEMETKEAHRETLLPSETNLRNRAL